LVTQGLHFYHLNESILVTQRVQFVSKRPCWPMLVTQRSPVCSQASILVTHGFHFDHPNGSILVTQGVPVCNYPSGHVGQPKVPFWSPTLIHCGHPRGSRLHPRGHGRHPRVSF
jgi:hypothetical protein